MQRSIKFRAWDGARNTWLHEAKTPDMAVHLIGETIMFGELWRRPDDSLVPIDEMNQVVWMQYTGLKDRRGAEIYEGDIVRIQHPHDKVVTDTGIELHGEFWDTLGRVFWWDHEGGWYHGHESVKDGNGRPPKRMWEYVEVIGNNYENPELLAPPTNKPKE